MEMREPSTTTRGDATAGMSGIKGDESNLPAFWAGGTYQNALDGVAKTILNHDGSGHLAGGNISWDVDGNAEFAGKIEALSGVIGGMTIEEDRLESENGNMILNGQTGKIELISDVTTYTEDGYGTTVEQTISINSQTGLIESSTSDYWAYVSAQGIYANRAGINAVSPESGLIIKSAIAGIGYGSLRKDAYNGNNIICGVYGHAGNSSSNPAPSYGGYFNKLKANGLYLNCRRISSSVTLTQNDVIISLYNTSTITINLPSSTYQGQIILLRLNNNSEISISGNGKSILRCDGAVLTSVTVGTRGELIFLIWDGQYWLYSTTQQ
jgi:hypothetical protein